MSASAINDHALSGNVVALIERIKNDAKFGDTKAGESIYIGSW